MCDIINTNDNMAYIFKDDYAAIIENIYQGLEAIGMSLETFMENVYSALSENFAFFVNTITSNKFIQELIDQVIAKIVRQESKYDKNITHFKKVNNTYNQPYYKIKPTARSCCRR